MLVSFSKDRDEPGGPVDVGGIEVDEFGYTHAGGIKQFDECDVACACGALGLGELRIVRRWLKRLSEHVFSVGLLKDGGQAGGFIGRG